MQEITTPWTTERIALFEQSLGTWAIKGNDYAELFHHQLSQATTIDGKMAVILTQILPILHQPEPIGAEVPSRAALKVLIKDWCKEYRIPTDVTQPGIV
ncbi:MAG TPA: hypothetical protein VH540_09945 [Ktedonobacterales bacterium]|jgi:hypothetical protein